MRTERHRSYLLRPQISARKPSTPHGFVECSGAIGIYLGCQDVGHGRPFILQRWDRDRFCEAVALPCGSIQIKKGFRNPKLLIHLTTLQAKA
jgi:hypothetical protein